MEMECNHRPLSAVAIHFIYTSSITQFMAMDLPKLLAWLERIESSYYTQTAPCRPRTPPIFGSRRCTILCSEISVCR